MQHLFERWLLVIFMLTSFTACTGKLEKGLDGSENIDLNIQFDSSDLVVMAPNSTRLIRYTIISQFDDITIEAQGSADIEITLSKTAAKCGTIQVITGSVINENSKVIVRVSDGNQAIMRTLLFEEEAIRVEENTKKTITDTGGQVVLEFFSNTACQAIIPEDAKDWISVIPNSKAMDKQSITLSIEKNLGFSRTATVQVVGKDKASQLVLFYTITQDLGGVWKEGIIPPNNEIWYVSKYGSVIQPGVFNIKPFDSSIISNTYENGRGVIRLDADLKAVYSHAFAGLTALSAIFLPDCVETIGTSAFYFTSISSFRVPNELKNTSSMFDGDKLEEFYGSHTTEDKRAIIIDKTLAAVAGKNLTSYVIPNNVNTIGSGAFNNCTALENIEIPEGVTHILDHAFAGCKSLRSITFPSSLVYLDSFYPFFNCENIEGFYGNPSFITPDNKCVVIDDTGDRALLATTKDLVDYVIPEGITFIINYCFSNSKGLRKVSFPNSLKGLDAYAFDGCVNVEEIDGYHLSSDRRGISFGTQYSRLIVSKGLSKYTVPDGITSIGYQAFAALPELEEIIIPDSVTELGGYDFFECPKLKKVILSSNLKTVRSYNPFLKCTNLEEVYFRSFTPPTYSDSQFNQEDCKNLIVYVPEETRILYENSSQWSKYAPYMVGYKYNDIGEWNPEYYISTDYSHNKEKIVLQTAISSPGIDLVLMGDGYSDRQIKDGTYEKVMRKAVDAFFSEEPFKSYKEHFNVSYINLVSMTEGYDHEGRVLGTVFGEGTTVSGNNNLVIELTKTVVPENRLEDALVIVMMNSERHAGTCYMLKGPINDYGKGFAVAYVPSNSDDILLFSTISHEAGGHGFGKLADEYAYESYGRISQDIINEIKSLESLGWCKNIDITNDPKQVKWSHFIGDSRYASEKIGCYEGAYTFWTGVWRSTEESIMNHNTGGFNAPSRYAIWYRINKLTQGTDWNGAYDDFVAYDLKKRSPKTSSRSMKSSYVEKRLPPLPPPVIIDQF